MRAALLALALAACSTGAPPDLPPPQLPERTGVDPLVAARAAGVRYQARGEGFTLALYRDEHITLTWDGQERAFFNPQTIMPAYRGEIYEARDGDTSLRVEIRSGHCPDAERGETWSANVSVALNDQTRRGCGRGL